MRLAPEVGKSDEALGFQSLGLIAVPGILGAVALLLMGLQWGAGVNSDSAHYIEEAYNVLAGRRISSLHYPPAFPVMLAGIQAAGFHIGDGARLLNALILGVNASLVGMILWRVSGSVILGTLGSLLMATSVDMLWVHFMVWPEPAFLLAVLLTLVFTHTYFVASRRRFLIMAALCGGLATLARYPGLALVATVALAQLVMSGSSRSRRLVDGAIVVVVGLLPIGAWISANSGFSGDHTVRTLAFHPISSDRVADGLSVASRWLVPLGPPLALRASASIAVLVLVALALTRGFACQQSQSRAHNFWLLGIIFISCYSALLVLSITFFDAQTLLDGRIMSPIFVVGLLIAASSLHSMASSLKRRLVLRTFTLLAIILACSYLLRAWDWGLASYTDGREYTGRTWLSSETLKLARELPQGTGVYSNSADVIEVLLGREAYMVPRRFDPTSLISNSQLDEELERM